MSGLFCVTLNPLFNNTEYNLRFLKGWYSTFYAFNISLPNGPSKEDAFFIMDNLLDLIENSKAVVECMYIVYSYEVRTQLRFNLITMSHILPNYNSRVP